MNKKMLLLDRGNDILSLAHEIMFYGYTDLHITDDINAVYKIAEDYMPDLVVLDFIYANENFEGLCQLFINNPVFKHTPVIVISTSYNKVYNNDTPSRDNIFIKPLDNKDFATQISYLQAS